MRTHSRASSTAGPSDSRSSAAPGSCLTASSSASTSSLERPRDSRVRAVSSPSPITFPAGHPSASMSLPLITPPPICISASLASTCRLPIEQVEGLEPPSTDYETVVLPLNHTCVFCVSNYHLPCSAYLSYPTIS